MGRQVVGWLLEEADREALLARFPPRFPDVVAHHVTLDASGTAALPNAKPAAVVGEADDGKGVQALVVAIDGSTDRPDGSTYHITWSLDRAAGRKPIESNDVIARLGWRPIAGPIPIRITPARI
jgi:hypothetical protein